MGGMKNNFPIHFATKAMKQLLAVGLVLGMLAAVLALGPAGRSPSDLLEKGIYTEETKGDLQSAVQIYQQVVEDPGADRSLMAQAQLRLGLCQLKLGDKPQAISALERLTQEFPDKDKLLAVVGHQMPQLLDEMVTQIEQNYVQEVDRSELMETAIRAIVGKLDGQAGLRTNDLEFLGQAEMAQFTASLEQKFVGIGAMLKLDDQTHEIVVQGLLPDSPGLNGGLLPGDRIVEINGAPVPADGNLAAAVKLIRGAPGTSVSLGVKRAGAGDLLTLELVRAAVHIPVLKGDHYNPDRTWDFMADDGSRIGYLRLTEVAGESARDMQTAIKQLRAGGMQGLVLDLRNNPGGLLDQAVAVSRLFVSTGRILTIKGRAGEQVYDATWPNAFAGFPMAVLVNRNTASAAEIIAACLQDHERAVVVGERTFGQGIVRSIFPLKDGVGSLKIPVASYFRPNGKTMNRYPGAIESDDWGVRPDPGYEVAMTDDELKAWEKDRNARDFPSESAPQTAPFQDRQWEKAMAYIREQIGRK
jgi:carboxyl-terminal processing protease